MLKWITACCVLVVVAIVGGTQYAATSERHALEEKAAELTSGDPVHGRELAQNKGCTGCHQIPGTTGAQGNVGPPLTRIATRVFVGGVLLNTPDNMRQWLLDPPRIDPKSAMPNVGLSDQEARDLAAYLYTLTE